MRVGLVAVVVAGCYAPDIAQDVPCAPASAAQRCPSGQACVNDVCVPAGGGPGADAPLEGGTIDDLDGDGVPNASDNCPSAANADQGNEDGDASGDLCDGCPPFADDTPDDTDGDGVEDRCDPHPTTAGDSIALFEGFQAGMPASWTIAGTWSAANDSVAIAAISSQRSRLQLPVTVDRSSTTSAGVVPLASSGMIKAIGITAPTDLNGDGIACLLFYPLASPNQRHARLGNTANLALLDYAPYTWVDGEVYTVAEQHVDDSYTCDVTDRLGTTTSFAANAGGAVVQGVANVGMTGFTGRIDWVMHVDSPNP